MPVYTIAATAEVEGSVVGKLLGQDNPNLGYHATKGLFCIFAFSHIFFG